MLDVEISVDDDAAAAAAAMTKHGSGGPTTSRGAKARRHGNKARAGESGAFAFELEGEDGGARQRRRNSLQFDMPLDDGGSGSVARPRSDGGVASVGSGGDADAALRSAEQVALVRESADKLDQLMLAMFRDVGKHCAPPHAASETARRTREGLLESFAVSVITTNRCKFVQFLAFYCASLGGSFATDLLDLLLYKVCDSNEAPLTRQVSCGSISSNFSL